MQSKLPCAVLCCAVCLLAVSHSEGQYECNLRGGKSMGTERDQMDKNQKDEYTTRIPRTAVRLKESTAQHDTAPQRRARHGTAPHGTTRRCAALLSYKYLG